MYPRPLLHGVEEGANVLILNVQYSRSKKMPDGSYSDDELFIVYRNFDTGEKKLQIIKNPKTDLYVTKEEHMHDWKTPREAVPFDMLDKHTVTYKERERYLYKLLADHLYSEEDKKVKQTIDYSKEIGKWNGRKEVHKWRHAYFSDCGIEDYVYTTAALHYAPKKYTLTKSFLDIETDIYGRSKYEHETGKCPISAVTLIYDYAPAGSQITLPRVFTLLLRNHERYPQQAAFERDLPRFMERVHKEFDHKYGKAEYNVMIYDDEDEMIMNVFKLQHAFKPDFTAIWNMSEFALLMLVTA